MSTSSKKNSFSSLLILGVIAVGLWLVFGTKNFRPLNQHAEPRAITARGDLAEDERNTIDVFRNTSPSVVYITSIALRRGAFSLNAVEIPQGTGSGFIWDTEGRIVTNYHVISDANRIQVTMSDHSSHKAVLVGAAPDKDLAVLQVSAPQHLLQPIPLGESENLLVGQKVFAIGNPFGLDYTITSGIISALGREINAITGRTIRGVIQTDAAINPGNSGGALVDAYGRMIGINTAIFSRSGGSQGVGFAIPSKMAKNIMNQLIKHGRAVRGWIGFEGHALTPKLVESLELDTTEGIIITAIVRNSPAHKAGLEPGDIIAGIDDNKVKSGHDALAVITGKQPGEKVTLQIRRDGRQYSVTATTIARPAQAISEVKK